jgi:hypothetical protein
MEQSKIQYDELTILLDKLRVDEESEYVCVPIA